MHVDMKTPNRSHWIELDYEGIRKEELYPILTAVIRGAGRSIECSADRYRHSSGMSDWRIYPRDVRPADGIGEATMREIRQATTPVIADYLASAEYRSSRRRAVYAAIVREIHDSRYDGGRRALERIEQHSAELRASDRKRLQRAIELRNQSAALLEIAD